ncbi:glycosyltransferase family 4 protein [Microvirgula aerodenitrificans]|uniref:glycosyltransferase family 4 protein n=1 Tax=Microvirgula aerodenitrificans TaxID=57480 RepID=UPI0028E698AD|nr:glycosyltransferase family 4 protein [Microvirgula aerodenitrificans]
MKILMLCTKFSLLESDGWLTNDLAAAFSEQGHDVTVVCLDWSGESSAQTKTLYENVFVINIPVNLNKFEFFPRSVKKLYKWFWASADAIPFVSRKISAQEVDIFIGFSPAATTFWLQRYLLKKVRPKFKYMILWDFFPRYHAELGLVPRGGVYLVAKYIENTAVNKYDVVGVMSEANVKFLHSEFYFPRGRVEVLPLWGPAVLADRVDRAAVRAGHNFPENGILCVFGGQLIPGRGIELLLNLARSVKDVLPSVLFVVAGKGPQEPFLRRELEKDELKNVRYIGQVPRDQYLQLIAACDIGLVFNSGTVSVPTFPSKTIDYFRAGLPILGAVEEATDFSEILQYEIGAGYSSAAKNIEQIRNNLLLMCESEVKRKEMGRQGQAYFLSRMTATSTVEKIIAAAVMTQ